MRIASAAFIATVLSPSSFAVADDYPACPISVIVGFAPGGPTDVTLRVLAQPLQAALGRPVVVLNLGGADGLIGAMSAMESASDGYTLYFGALSTLNRALVPNSPNDVLERMDPIAEVMVSPFCVFLNSSLKANTLAELIAYAKQDPGVLNYAASAASTTLGMEMLKQLAGIDVVSIPFSGGGPAATALITNQVQISMSSPTGANLADVEAGAMRPLACTDRQRFKTLPAVPTMEEAGFPDIAITVTNGFWAPHGMARTHIDKLAAVIAKIVEDPAFAEKILQTGSRATSGTADQLMERVRNEREFWNNAAQRSGF
jgi:tripartite-type tricarboxylate transporter receptor subunit TctC